MPFAPGSFDGVISVEAAFHFPSRLRFFAEAFRVLRPGGVLTFSDVPVLRFPATPRELVAGVAMLRLWGIRAQAAATPLEIERQVSAAGFDDVVTSLEGARVIGPAFRSVHARLDQSDCGSVPERLAARTMLREAEVLWDLAVLEYAIVEVAQREVGAQARGLRCPRSLDLDHAGHVAEGLARHADVPVDLDPG